MGEEEGERRKGEGASEGLEGKGIGRGKSRIKNRRETGPGQKVGEENDEGEEREEEERGRK